MIAELLIGNWKLVSWQVVTEDGAKDLFGHTPNGYFIVTRGGRAMTVTTAEGRTPGETDAERGCKTGLDRRTPAAAWRGSDAG